MGRIAKLLSFVRVTRNDANISDVKSDPGGGANITGEHFAPIGEDAHPLPGDFVALSDTEGTGRENAIGYIDPNNEQKSSPGDKRIYARDPDTGAVVVEVWLKNDGTAETINDNGSVTLAPDGSITAQNSNGSHALGADGSVTGQNSNGSHALASDGSITGTNNGGTYSLGAGGTFDVNGVTVSPAGVLTVPASMVLAGKEMAGHGHAQGVDSAGDTQQDTGANI